MSIIGIGTRISCICAIASLVLVTGIASADVTSDMGAGFAVPDNTYNGMDSGYASGTINVTGHTSDPGLTISDVQVQITATHTWVGDLVIFVESPDGTRVGLLSRPGLPETGLPGQCCGFGDNWTNTPERWFPGANTDTEPNFILPNFGIGTMWGGANGNAVMMAGAGADLANFNGGAPNGTWTLRVSDGAGADIGSVGSWRLDITSEGGDGCAFALGDVNNDGVVSLLDVSPFVSSVTGGAKAFVCEADINEDGVVSLLDVAPFVSIVTGG